MSVQRYLDDNGKCSEVYVQIVHNVSRPRVQDMVIYRRPVVVFLVCVYEWLLQNYSIAVVLLLN